MKSGNVMIVGVGGQGSLLASKLLGHLLIKKGYDVKVSEVHGMSQRGGSVVTYVRFGDKVNSPVIDKGGADYIVSFEILEAARWISYLKKDGQIVTNTQQIDPMPVVMGADEYPENLVEKMRDKGVRVDALDSRLAGFTELSLQEAQLLRNSSGKDYRRCILRCRKLLSELSHDEDTLQENLSIISGQYPAIAKDLSGDFSEPDPETESETDQKKGPVRKKSSNHKRKQKSVVFSILFAGCYLALVMSLCGLFTQLARQQQNPALFVGGIAAVIAGGFLLMILNAVTDLLRREQHISMNGIFMAGVILTVIAAIAAAAGFPAAAIVSGAGTVISGAILTHR